MTHFGCSCSGGGLSPETMSHARAKTAALDVDIAIPDRAQTEPLLSPQWLLERGPKAVPTTPILE
jgi:hypothetical protein